MINIPINEDIDNLLKRLKKSAPLYSGGYREIEDYFIFEKDGQEYLSIACDKLDNLDKLFDLGYALGYLMNTPPKLGAFKDGNTYP